MADLFGSLPDPVQPPPAASASPAAPGSRRAAREAAARTARSDTAGAGSPAPSAARATDPVSAGPPRDDEPFLSTPASASGARDAEAAPASLADLLDQTQDDREVADARARKKNRRRGCLVVLALVLVLLGGVAAAGIWVWNAYGDRIADAMGWGEPQDYEAGQAGDPVLITISSGDTGSIISNTLYEAGVTMSPSAFYDMLVSESVVVTFYPGVYELRERMSAAEALAAIEDPANRRENSVLLREGLTVDRSVEEISEQLGFPVEDVLAAVENPADYGVDADSLEGWLFPAVYTFDDGSAPRDVIARMVDRTRESLASAGVPDSEAQRILTIASIIEREARLDEDFYRVSRVIQNRLDDDMMLQMDSTAQYGYNELHAGQASTSAEAQYDDNPWNTYVHYGLPAGPIANPGDLAIDAAMNPVDGPWLYFVTVNLSTGETQFSETYAEHLSGVEEWRAWCRENPNSGC